MNHIKRIISLILLWITVYFIFAFLDWNLYLIKDILKSIPEKESSRFIFIVWIVLNCIFYNEINFKNLFK